MDTVHPLLCDAGRDGEDGEVIAHVRGILLGFGMQVNSYALCTCLRQYQGLRRRHMNGPPVSGSDASALNGQKWVV